MESANVIGAADPVGFGTVCESTNAIEEEEEDLDPLDDLNFV